METGQQIKIVNNHNNLVKHSQQRENRYLNSYLGSMSTTPTTQTQNKFGREDLMLKEVKCKLYQN